MEEILKLDPIMKVGGSVDLPGSKSISNRALLLAALSEGTTELNNLLVAEDTEMMIGALETLGVKLEVSNDGFFSGMPVPLCVRCLPLWRSVAANTYWTASLECVSARSPIL